MKLKTIIPILFAIVISLSSLLVVKSTPAKEPREVYQVYVSGESIGLVESKKELESYINAEQEELKEKYGVNTIYPPNGLSIQKIVTYDENILTAQEIYEIIKEDNPFTIKGYTYTIYGDQNVVINVLNRDVFENSLRATIKVFVPEEDLNNFENGTDKQIEDNGRVVENMYLIESKEKKLTEKESYISVDDKIFLDENELTKYLLFGSLEEEKTYSVKKGDTIEKISFNNKLGIEEFLIVNSDLADENSLLYEGQKVKIGLINPLVHVVVQTHEVSEDNLDFDTQIKYDSTKYAGYSTVQTQGVKGKAKVTRKYEYNNGEIVNVVTLSSETIKSPVNKVIVKGTRPNINYTNVIRVTDGEWGWPTNRPYVITSYYGWRWGKLHEAIDISGCGYGSPIYAVRDGIVTKTAYNSTSGNYVNIDHQNGYQTNYLHLAKYYVKPGQKVVKGQVIGLMGNSGFSTGTHLHFGVWLGTPYGTGVRSINPLILYQ